MPVLIFAASADLDLTLPLATRLRNDGSEVRCYLDDDSYELRNIGCKIAVGRLDDDANLEGALTNVHTFIPFLPDPVLVLDETGAKEMLEMARGVARAANGAGIPQTIVSLPAFDRGDGPIPAAYAAAEEEFVEQVKPLCVIRTGFIWGPDRPFTRMVSGLSPDERAGRTASVTRVEDLAAVLAAADDREQIEGTWEFSSPTVSLESLRPTALPAGGVPSPPWIMDLLSRGFVVGSSAVQELGVSAEPIA
jgi:hypothetical protein